MDTCKSSGFQTADSLIVSGPCLLVGAQVYSDATNAATLVVYDGQTAAGKAVFKAIANAEAGGGSGSCYEKKDWLFPLQIDDGIYCDITGTNAEYCIEYIEG